MADDNIEKTKQRLIDKARDQVKQGAHYLWSAAGNTPGNKDGASYRPQQAQLHPNVPDLDEFNNGDRNLAAAKLKVHVPLIFGAFASTSDFGLLACTGRAGVVSYPLAIGDLNSNIGKALDLKLKGLSDDQIEEFIENATDPYSYRWPRPNSSVSNNTTHHSTVWGESCVGTRHLEYMDLSTGVSQKY